MSTAVPPLIAVCICSLATPSFRSRPRSTLLTAVSGSRSLEILNVLSVAARNRSEKNNRNAKMAKNGKNVEIDEIKEKLAQPHICHVVVWCTDLFECRLNPHVLHVQALLSPFFFHTTQKNSRAFFSTHSALASVLTLSVGLWHSVSLSLLKVFSVSTLTTLTSLCLPVPFPCLDSPHKF